MASCDIIIFAGVKILSALIDIANNVNYVLDNTQVCVTHLASLVVGGNLWLVSWDILHWQFIG